MTVGAHGVSRALGMVMLAAMVVASCSKRNTEPVPTPEPEPQEPQEEPWTPVENNGDNGTPITFGKIVTSEDVPTKSGVPVSLSTVYNSFKVYAFYQQGNAATGYTGSWDTGLWTPNLMYNQDVTFNNNSTPADPSDDFWEYTPVKYWPNNTEDTVTFWAYAPANAPVTLRSTYADAAYSPTTTGLPGVLFTVDPADPYDLLVSEFHMEKNALTNPAYPTYYTLDLSKQAVGGAVNFLFRHALCQVNFKAAKEDAEFDLILMELSIQDILFTGIHVEGGWAAGTSARSDFEVLTDDEGDDMPLSTTPSSLILSPDAMLLPQRLIKTASAEPLIYVKYKFRHAGVGEYTIYETTVSLGEIQASWQEGNTYTYTLRISPGNPILFVADVEPWDSDLIGYFNVS